MLMMVKVKDKVQTCGTEEVSETNVILISTEVSGLKLRVEEWWRMQTGCSVLQGKGGTAVSSNTKDTPKHCSIILQYLRKHKDAPALTVAIEGTQKREAWLLEEGAL